MAAEHAADRATELEQELEEELALDLRAEFDFHGESEFDVETESSVRPHIRSICGEAQRIRSRLLTAQGALRGRAIVHARKWLRRTSSRWPYERLQELTRRDLDILAGCLYGVASAMGEEPEPYRRLRSDIGKLLGVPAGELEGGAELEEELEDEAAELELLSPEGPIARKCDGRGIPVKEPRRAIGKVACTQSSAHGVADPISVLKKARERALDMLDNTIDELANARKAVCAGATPAWPLLGDITICWLKNGLGVNTDDIRVWTAGTFEPIRSVAEVIRRLVRVRNLLAGSGLRYSCTSPSCTSGEWAFVRARDPITGNCLPGTPLMLIRLCEAFWRPA